MTKWKKLDMSRADGHPEPGSLTVLCMAAKSGFAADWEIKRYEVGAFKTDERSGSRKLWWHEGRGSVSDSTDLKKRHDVWWLTVAEFDGGKAL